MIIRVESCGTRYTHRVVEIRQLDGTWYYLTKGDAFDKPDNCWAPHRDVLGVVVKVERNLYPENTKLRQAVNAAKAEMLANPRDPDAVARYHCWRRAAYASRYPGDIPHEC